MNTVIKKWLVHSRLNHLLLRLVRYGVQNSQSDSHQRNLIISNAISLIFSIALLLIAIVMYTSSKYNEQVKYIFFTFPLLLILPLFMNRSGKSRLSRLVLACLPPLMVISISIITKLTVDDLTFNDYYNFRIALIALCCIPFLLFSLDERKKLIFSLIVCATCLVLSDYLHHFFNVGFYDIGFQDTHYNFISVTSAIASLAIMLAFCALKAIIERQEKINLQLVMDLQNSNEEISSQRDELMTQGERLNQNQMELYEAYRTIEKQKVWLEEELAINDFEITQFSYNVAHHLRGPVASLAGLSNLYAVESDTNYLLPHLKKAVKQLEEVVADLNHVLDIRKDIFRQKTDLSLTKLVKEATQLLSKEWQIANPELKLNLDAAPVIYAAKVAMINILVNLLSNAIKFRDPNMPLVIEINAYKMPDKDQLMITIRDNGIGIDLHRHQKDLFKMYKRFHIHTEGKGLGLYLVRLQVLALGGTIEIDSQLADYTKVILTFPLGR